MMERQNRKNFFTAPKNSRAHNMKFLKNYVIISVLASSNLD